MQPPSDACHNKNKTKTKTMNLLQQAVKETKLMINICDFLRLHKNKIYIEQ